MKNLMPLNHKKKSGSSGKTNAFYSNINLT